MMVVQDPIFAMSVDQKRLRMKIQGLGGAMTDRRAEDDILMDVAWLISSRGTCSRLLVGAVLAKEGRILSTGYNGAPAGLKHCEHFLGSDLPCKQAVHAEANAVAFAAKHGVSTLGSSMYTTHSPCMTCAHLIINAGISQVFYKVRYRDLLPIDELVHAGVSIVHMQEEIT